MSADDRLRPIIKLTSPEGNVFEAKWQKSTVTNSKKLGIFAYPQFVGEQVQDLDINSDKYAMTIYFDGEDHDQDAKDFTDAMKERGQWDVVHPVLGPLALQPIDFSKVDDPIASNNVTAISLNWIEPANQLITLSEEEAAAALGAQALKTNESFLDQLSNLKQDTFAAIQAAKNAIDTVTNVIDSVLGPIAATVTELNDAFNQIQGSIQNLLNSAILDPLQLLGQITNLVQLPGLAINDFQARMTAYVDLAEQVFGLAPEDDASGGGVTTDENFNTILINELVLGAVLVAVAQTSADSEFSTRSQVIDAADQSASLLKDVVDNLDTQQALYQDIDIDRQYFSQSSGYNDIIYMMGLSQRRLLKSLFDLNIEKRFILTQDTSTLALTVTEYGELGDADINYNLMVSSNNLQGNDILFMRAGSEVVVYV